jgi:ferredoxin
MKVRLDRTMCDGFGICAKHAPEYFSLDDWGYASLVGNGVVPEEDRDAVTRALLDCPVHAIIELKDQTLPTDKPLQPSRPEERTGDTSVRDDRADTAEPVREAQMLPGL